MDRASAALILVLAGPLPAAAGTLYLATSPTGSPFALVGRAYSLDFEGYGPNPESDGPYTYTPSKTEVDGLTFSTIDNVLRLSGTPTAAGKFPFKVTVADPAGDSGEVSYELSVCSPTSPGINFCLADLSTSLPVARAGVPYSQVLHAAGGDGRYTYSLPDGVDGLTLFAYGGAITLSGTPSLAGTFSFTIATTDGADSTGLQSFKLQVGLGLVPGQMPAPGDQLAPGLVGLSYRQAIDALGGTGQVTYKHPETVDGLTFAVEENTLVLSGTPTAAGSFPFKVRAQDDAGHVSSFRYTLYVAASPATLEVVLPGGGTTTRPTSLLPAQAGSPYAQEFRAAGGSGSYTFLYPDDVANGLRFEVAKSGDTLTLHGTPTAAGTFGYTLAVNDGFGDSRVQTYRLTVAAAGTELSVGANDVLDLPAGTVNQPYAQSFAAFGGSGSSQFSTSAPTKLPRGLSFAQYGPNFVLSGTPAEEGAFPIILNLQDDSETATRSFVLRILPPEPLRVARELMPPGMQGMGFTQALISNALSDDGPTIAWSYYPYQLTAEGGSGEGYAFTATGLPPGMTFSATGEVGGTPALAGDFPVAVTVTDGAGQVARKSYTLVVPPSPPFVGNPYYFFAGVANPIERIRKAYGFDDVILPGGILGDGRGQTIAVLENSDQGTLVSSIPGLTLNRPDQVSYADSDLARFSAAYGLPQFGAEVGPDAPVFVKLDATGGTSYPLPLGANGEFAMDVMTIHSLAPRANIVVFVVPSDLYPMYRTMMSFPHNLESLPAKTRELLKELPSVSVVSSSVYNSYHEDIAELNRERLFLPPFPDTQPGTVVIAAGDTGYFPPKITGPQYPGNSAHVISAAMTQPSLGADGRLLGEIGVSSAGGGVSLYLPQPPWQNGVVDAFSTTRRVGPDVGMLGSFNSGSLCLLNGQWIQGNGSSNAAPSWAALVAITNQGRELLGQKPLDGTTETLPLLYGLPAADFHKITQLDNGTNVRGSFNAVAGLGTPVASRLVPGMLGGHNTIEGAVRDGATGTGLSGWTVFLDANDDGIHQRGREGSTTTGAGGEYSFLVSPGRDYRVRVEPPAGSLRKQTSPNPESLSFAPGADHAAAGVDFLFAPPR